MDIKELKKLLVKHSEIENRLNIINTKTKERYWAKFEIPRGEYFCLDDKDVLLLKEHYEKIKLDIENKINEVMR